MTARSRAAALPLPLRAGLALLLALLLSAAARGQGAVTDGVERFEARVGAAIDAWDQQLATVPVLGQLKDRVRVSGSWLGTHFESGPGSQVESRSFPVWDAQLAVDVTLLEEADFAATRLVNAVGALFEWQFYRLGLPVETYGEVLLDLQGVAGSRWLNVQIGRFQIPVGENYLRFGVGYRDNPFISNTVGGAWWWDEGVRFYGGRDDGLFSYVASVSSGETPRSVSLEGGGQVTLKLITEPTRWLRLSASALWSGRTGAEGEPAQGALWLGEGWARAFGSGSPVPNFYDGRVIADGPDVLDRTVYLGADAVLTHPRGARLWLSYGTYEIDSSGRSLYDRRLHSWIAELVLEGRLATPALRPFYVAARANGVGTYDGDRGYQLDFRYAGRVGYNMRSLDAYSLGLGWRVTRWATLRVEYTFQQVGLVRGANDLIDLGRADYFGVAYGLQF